MGKPVSSWSLNQATRLRGRRRDGRLWVWGEEEQQEEVFGFWVWVLTVWT